MNQQPLLTMQFCRVTLDSLNIRTTPNTELPPVTSFPRDTVLNFIEVVEGEMINGIPYWGHSAQGHYFWMGGTDWHK
jgi:hypothetical protein